MNKGRMSNTVNRRISRQERGATVLEMVVTIVILVIITAFAIFGINSARASFRLSGSARIFTSYLEKARSDSVRRHAEGADQASVQIVDATTYRVQADFDANGTPEFRIVFLDQGVRFSTAPTTIAFDSRGRTTGTAPVGLENGGGQTTRIEVTNLGDSMIDQSVPAPTVHVNTSVNTNAYIAPDSTVAP